MVPPETGLPSDTQPDQSPSRLTCRACHAVLFCASTAPPSAFDAMVIPST
jgi:hypothetical protein